METKTRIRSIGARFLSSSLFLDLQRNKARLARKINGTGAVVHYFHQIDDPYSHLCVQKLDQLKATYNLPFQSHLVSKPDKDYQGSSEHFDAWAIRDALSVAEAYGTVYTAAFGTEKDTILSSDNAQGGEHLTRANNLLAPHLQAEDFASHAFGIGQDYWQAKQLEASNKNQSANLINAGNTLRQALGHYAGGMFYFDGEWFWGIDRIRVLEQQLTTEGFNLNNVPPCVPEPSAQALTNTDALKDTHNVTLEYFPSLRSPYTAIGHQRVLDMIERTGINVELRPVMPMLMRGIPAPFAKQRYIIQDAAREARFRNIPFGKIVDPFGEPVKRAFALFPAAKKLGKGMEFVGEYLAASWANGLDITNDTGLKLVAAKADIDWQDLQQARQGTDWESVLDDNLEAMLEAGLWGVPSFRVSGGSQAGDPYCCWGQDRIWRVENEIVDRLKK